MSGSCKKSVRFSNEYLLFVTNLPFELNEDGIKKVFDEYGRVNAVMARNAGQFAFVSYSTYAEAENAVKSLDRQPPLYLRVQFGRRQQPSEGNELGSTITGNCNVPNELMMENVEILNSGLRTEKEGDNVTLSTITNDGTGVDESRIKLLRSRLPIQNYYIYPAASYPMIPVHWPYYPDYNSTVNSFWSKEFMTTDAAGRKYVSMGRGYVSYNISDPKPRIIQDIGKVYEDRQPGCYKYGSDQCKTSIGKCINCSKTAALSCSVCESFYCSRACQISDWPSHQRKCMKIPPLIDTINIIESQHQTFTNAESLTTNIENQTADNVIKCSNTNTVDASMPNENPVNQNLDNLNDTSPLPTENDGSMDLHHTEKNQSIAVNDIISVKNTNVKTENVNPITNIIEQADDGVTTGIDEQFLSEIIFIQVLISAINEPGKSYYVQKVEDMDRLEKLMTELNENIEQLKRIEMPMVGGIYAILYENIWHRGLVLSLTPIVVDYIDWGTVGQLPQELIDFRDIGELAKVPRFSQLIKLSKSQNLELNNIISVKKINVVSENGIRTINVDVLNETIAADSPISQGIILEPQQQLPSILNYMNVGMTVAGEIGDVVNNYTTRVVLSFEAIAESFENLLNPLKNDCDDLASTYVNYEPRPHDWVAMKKPEDIYWFRGYVLKYKESSSTVIIASVDEGTLISQVDKIIPLPSKYKDIGMFSVVMKTEASTHHPLPPSVQAGKIINLTVLTINYSNDDKSIQSVDVTLENEFGIIEGLKLYQWKPWETLEMGVPAKTTNVEPDTATNNTNNNDNKHISKEEAQQVADKKKIKHIELKDDSRVMLQSYRTPHIVFLRSLEPEETERHHQLIQKVAKCGSIAVSLDKLPQASDYVLAQYVDGNYYRATVILADAITQDVKVLYIDYGDIEVTKLDKLKVMPESLMDEPQCVKKVKLHGIKSAQPTEDVLQYLSNLVNNEEPLVYKFHSVINSEIHVTLKTATGNSVNDQINYLLTPTWERDNKLATTSEALSSELEVTSEQDQKINCDSERDFNLNDIDLGKLGRVGETLSALLLETIEPGIKYVFGLEDNDMIMQLTSIMPQNMKKYAESSVHYIPRNNELCIARFDDNNWYRGCCINPAISSTSALVYFIDFGNTAVVEHSNIRKMIRDFLKPPAFGCICSIQDFINLPNNDQLLKVLERLESLLLSNQAYQIEVVNFDGSEYHIRLPEVNKTLSEEGLLPPFGL